MSPGPVKKVNIKRLYRSGANQVISPESSGAEDIYFAAIQPTIMKITEMHDVADIRRESEIILKHGCTLENIEYHLPEFKEPLARKIGITEIEQLNRFLGSLEKDPHRKKIPGEDLRISEWNSLPLDFWSRQGNPGKSRR
nr:3H domain-containing protein [Methanobacterium formicicum]